MDRAIFIGFCLLGLGISMAIFLPLGPKRRSLVPYAAWWLLLGVGSCACLYGLSHSTAPSFAPRATVIGKAYDHVEVRQGRDSHYGFHFVPNDGGQPINIETSIIIPGWANAVVFSGRTYRIVYLKTLSRALLNEAIDIQILSGRDAGFHDTVDASPFGSWLAIPLGAALVMFGYLGLRYKKDDEIAAKSGGDDSDPT